MSSRSDVAFASKCVRVNRPPLATHEGRHHFISAHLPAQENVSKKNKKWAGLEKLVFYPPLATHESRRHLISALLPAQENKQK